MTEGVNRPLVFPTGRTIRNGKPVRFFGRVEWCMVGDYTFERAGVRVTIPDGATSDGVSAPWWAVPFIRSGALILPAFVHDEARRNPAYGKMEGDGIFLAAMEAEHTPFLERECALFLARANNNRD